jgi:hypothetical protein
VCHPEADNELDDEECSSDTYDRQKQKHIVSFTHERLLNKDYLT